jgi:hypothetical protein
LSIQDLSIQDLSIQDLSIQDLSIKDLSIGVRRSHKHDRSERSAEHGHGQ